MPAIQELRLRWLLNRSEVRVEFVIPGHHLSVVDEPSVLIPP